MPNCYFNFKELPKENINLMIVAHPDDEILWGGKELLNEDYTYFVICLTNGNDIIRKKKFFYCLNLCKQYGIIFDYANCVNIWNNNNYQKDIENTINYFLKEYNFNKIVTHNKYGEYGHEHHISVNNIVTKLILEQKKEDKLYYFAFDKHKVLDNKIINIINIYFDNILENIEKDNIHVKNINLKNVVEKMINDLELNLKNNKYNDNKQFYIEKNSILKHIFSSHYQCIINYNNMNESEKLLKCPIK